MVLKPDHTRRLWNLELCKRSYTYSLRGSNPVPMAHKTIALTTELRELLMVHPAQQETPAGAHVPCATAPVGGQAKARKAMAFDPIVRKGFKEFIVRYKKSIWLPGLVVCFLVRLREVPVSIPGAAFVSLRRFTQSVESYGA